MPCRWLRRRLRFGSHVTQRRRSGDALEGFLEIKAFRPARVSRLR
jgi:hypothetical protein